MLRLFLIFIIVFCKLSYSQVGINTSSPNLSSMLDITSLDKGLLIPRISLTSTNSASPIISPAVSLLVYNTATSGAGITSVYPGYYYWDGAQWLKINTGSSSSNFWNLSGNSGLDAAINYIGTNDNTDIRFKRNNKYSGIIGINNTSLGYYSLDPLINTGVNNTSIGSYNLFSNTTGHRNTSIGANVMSNNTSGSFNVAFGVSNMNNNTTGANNISIGYLTMYDNTTGGFNVAIGSNALRSSISSTNNIAIGYSSMLMNTIGSGNVALGTETLSSNTTGLNNTALGYYAMDTNTTGQFNTGVGNSASYLNTTGNRNVALGCDALYQNSTGNLNVAIGSNAGFNVTGSNNIIIGANTSLPNNSGSNQIRIGDTNITYAGTQVAWSITSDYRWKSNIQNSKLGLDFIMQLRPVSYFRKDDENKKLEFGLIAQELEQVLNNFEVENNGIITKNNNEMLSVRYNDLIAPLIKSIQEQQETILQLKKEIDILKNKLK